MVSEVNLFGVRFKVHIMPDDLMPVDLGRESYDRGNIYINETCVDDQRAKTLLHEILHIIIREFNLEFEKEEDVTLRLSNGLFTVLRDNPELKKVLF